VLTILTFDIDDITQQDFQLRVCTVGGCASGVACWPQQRSGAASSCPFRLRGSAVSARVKILGNVYDFRISWK
jgi:hypothetical protein